MNNFQLFSELSPCSFADVLPRENIMDIGVRPLWQDMPRIAGPAFPVCCAPGDNLMLHVAIYKAPAGSIIVVDTGGDIDYAVAGGNVCKIAASRGIAGFIIDGVIRDIAEIREIKFPVFARGLMPKPGIKECLLKILINPFSAEALKLLLVILSSQMKKVLQ